MPRPVSFLAPGAVVRLLAFLFFATADSAGQSVRTWTQRDGLPSDEITALHQDRDGYLYVSTADGLVRFDGSRFTRVAEQNGAASHRREFAAIVEPPDSHSLLLVPRAGGLLRLTGDTVVDEPLPDGFESVPLESLVCEPGGAMWYGFKGGIVLRRSPAGLERFDTQDGLNPVEPVQLVRDGAGRIWIASGRFLARYEGGTLQRIKVNTGEERLRLAPAARDGPWVLADEHLFKLHGDEPRRMDKVNSHMAAYFTQVFVEDTQGYLWFGTRSRGLRRWLSDGDVRSVIQVPEDITCILEDNLGNIWAGSNGGGLMRLKPGIARLYNRSVGLFENHSLAVCEDVSGRMWFANRDGGIAWLNTKNRAVVIEKARMWDKFSVSSVASAPEGGIWASTTNGMLKVDERGIVGHLDDPAVNEGAAPDVMLTARNGDLWVALKPTGVARVRDMILTRMDSRDATNGVAIRTLAEDPSGRIWAGGEDGGLFRREGGRFVRIHSFDTAITGPVHALAFDRDGHGWIGTERGGLIRQGPAGLHAITGHDGLVSDNVTQIVPDGLGYLWLGSPAGISYLRIDEIEAHARGEVERVWPALLGPDEGLSEVTCLASHQPAVHRSANGMLWFATRQGILALDPQRQHAAPASLALRIDSLLVDGLKQSGPDLLRIASQARVIEFRFSPLSLATPERVRTRYRLVGLDESWTEAGTDGARYMRLPPGAYRFEAAAFIAGRPDLTARDAIDFEVEAAWWQTPWAQGGAALAAVGLVVVAVRRWSHRRLQRRLARLERDSVVERERTRIARNIHDEMGAGLTRISLLTQSAHEGAAASQLDRIYRTVNELTQSMDEIVWAVNPKNDDLERMTGYIGEFAQGYLADAGLACRVHIPPELPALTVTAQFRHHLFLACKEALHNIVKHANASHVSLRVEVDRNSFAVTVADDGVGCEPCPESAFKHHGHANMRARLAAIGGTMTIRRTEPRGTEITLTALLAPASADA